MKKTSTNFRRQTNRVRRDRLCRPFVESLEERLPPGDTILGALLGWSWTQAAAGTRSFLSQEDAELALEGRPSLATDAISWDMVALGATLPPFQGSGRDGGSDLSQGLRPGLSAVAPPGLSDGTQAPTGEPIPGLVDEVHDWMDFNPARPRQAGMRFIAADLIDVHPSADIGPGFSGLIAPQPFWMSASQATAQSYRSSEGQRVNLVASTIQSPLSGPHGAVHALFHLDMQGEAPFPTNHFTVPDRSNLTGLRVNLPYPDCNVFISDCQDLTMINQLDGFNMQPRLSIPFDGPIDAHSVNSQSVFLIRLGDVLDHHDPGGQVVGINQTVWDTFTNTLHVQSDELLDQHTRYALIITNGLRDADGRPVEASEAFRNFRHDVRGEYRHELLDAIHAARRLGVRESNIVDASVFTTESATAVLEKIRDQIHAATPEPADFNLGSKTERTVFNVDDVKGITFNEQDGADPIHFTPVQISVGYLQIIPGAVGTMAFGKYLSPDYEVHPGEYIPPVGTHTGTPVVQGMNDVYFNLFLPSGPKPEGGWPVAIFGHGGGSTKNDFGTFVGASMAAHGIATIGIETVGNGFGPLGTLVVNQTDGSQVTLPSGGRSFDQDGNGDITSLEGFFAAEPRRIMWWRDSVRQTTADLMQLVRVIQQGIHVTGDATPDLDASRIYYFGQSQGGSLGPIFTAVEPDVKAAVFSVGFGSFINTNRQGSGGTRHNRIEPYLNARVPSVINSPGAVAIDGVSVGAPGFNENLPLRNGIPMQVHLADGTDQTIRSPVINTVAGAMEIQKVMDDAQWVMLSGDALGYVPHVRKAPLAGVAAKSVIVMFGKGDRTAPNPMESALVRAGDLADRTTFFRNDLAYAHHPEVPVDPHSFMSNVFTNPATTAIALEAQWQIATFFESDGTVIIQPEPKEYFEVPIKGPLPEDLSWIV